MKRATISVVTTVEAVVSIGTVQVVWKSDCAQRLIERLQQWRIRTVPAMSQTAHLGRRKP
jgi:hypothetical protein